MLQRPIKQCDGVCFLWWVTLPLKWCGCAMGTRLVCITHGKLPFQYKCIKDQLYHVICSYCCAYQSPKMIITSRLCFKQVILETQLAAPCPFLHWEAVSWLCGTKISYTKLAQLWQKKRSTAIQVILDNNENSDILFVHVSSLLICA